MKKFIINNLRSLIAILTATILIIAGLLAGQHLQVLQKAIRICLECIGIG